MDEWSFLGGCPLGGAPTLTGVFKLSWGFSETFMEWGESPLHASPLGKTLCHAPPPVPPSPSKRGKGEEFKKKVC